MTIRPTRLTAGAAALALALAACADDPTSAAHADASGGPSANVSAPSGVALVSNAVKYRDSSRRPGSGRAGSAQATALALLGKDGVAQLTVTAAPADSTRTAAPNITKVKVKATSAQGGEIFTQSFTELNAGATYTRALGGLARGTALEVQTNVTGIDPSRTDIVTVTERVKLRPDLSVALQAPSNVRTGDPVSLLAVVSEENGDVGARTDCVLYVDQVARDRVNGAWVDAGDAVTCAFTHVFDGGGSRRVEVRLENVNPGDYDPANNSRTVFITVQAGGDFWYDALVQSDSTWQLTLSSSDYLNKTTGLAQTTRDSIVQTRRNQHGQLYGFMERAVPRPYTIHVSQATGGRALHDETYSSETDGYNQPGSSCISDYDYTGQIFFSSCVSSDPWWGTYTSFRYDRYAGSVTYHSTSYRRTWDPATATENVYHSNTSSGSGQATIAPHGSTYAFGVTYASGDSTWTASPVLALREVVVSRPLAESCSTYDYELYYSRQCGGTSFYTRALVGREAFGPPSYEWGF
ncbi:hypothetical protein [Longimicrobium sp.]|uniref:hypothetical protein n=1 Tax=Longimicrobium sp. TaxID=2029185 RepID=UPI002E2F17BC|nr:hypothetical protein [Longimicrobium sp.]HEX6037549.1 hypothetical protein [Longimicrobium sp.]